MTDYTLYYWPIPFRGQFIRAVLAHIGVNWDEPDFEAVLAQRSLAPADQKIAHMGPPVLIDKSDGTCMAQLPAVLIYLGEKHGLLPQDVASRAATLKVIGDANDVLYEMTLYNGSQMWTAESWRDFQPRLARWMAIFEETGKHFGLSEEAGHMLGTSEPGIADLVTGELWQTIIEKFPVLGPMLAEKAPSIAALSGRIATLPAQQTLRKRSRELYGDLWCGGDIERSLRAVAT